MISEGEYYSAKARQLQERERSIKAPRGQILDRNGVVLADNQSVYSISVVHNQIKDIDKVVEVLSKELQMDEEAVRKKVEKVTSLEKIKGNVEKYFSLREDDLFKDTRSQNIAYPRQIAMYLCKNMTDIPLDSIGTLLGGRDHSTIIHGINKISKELETNENTRTLIETIKKKINPN